MRPTGAPRVDFIGLGAPKCRTTWLAKALDQHPKITISRDKEPNHLVRHVEIWTDEGNPRYLRDWDWYADQFSHARPGDALGDFSVTLMSNLEDGPTVVHELYPDARFIVLLRDPVRRAVSDHWHCWGRLRHVYDVPRRFEDALSYERLLLRSRYGQQLDAWMSVFGADRFLVLLDEDLNEDALGAVQRVFRFLGVAGEFVPTGLTGRVNPAHARRGLLWGGYRLGARARSMGLGSVVNAAKRLGAERLLDRADRRTGPPPPLNPNTEHDLRQSLMDDIERTEQILGRDLSAWKTGGT